MFEHIIVSNIVRHLDKHELLTDCQHGFRRRRSCEKQLLTLADELIKGLDKGRQLDLAILDFSKAFDCVPHERLLKKLDHYISQGKTLDWIRAFLTHRTQNVTVEGVVSESIHVKSGVPQGSVVGKYSSSSLSTTSLPVLNLVRDTIRQRLPDSPRWSPETMGMGEVVGNVIPPWEMQHSSSA